MPIRNSGYERKVFRLINDVVNYHHGMSVGKRLIDPTGKKIIEGEVYYGRCFPGPWMNHAPNPNIL